MQIKLAPNTGPALDTDSIIAVEAVDKRMLILVDFDRFNSMAEIGITEIIIE